MGLCGSKRPTREPFDPIGSIESDASTNGLNPSGNAKPKNGERTNENKYEESNLLDAYDVEHFLLQNVWDSSHFSSPIAENLKIGKFDVLDVNCGSGHWIYNAASEFSKSKFTGIHASPTSKKIPMPRNSHVLRIDILGEKKYDDDSFDYVHMRALSPRFTDEQWKRIISQMIRLTKPGGYCEIEVGDYKGFENEPPFMKRMIDAHLKCLEMNGTKINVMDELEQIMKDTNRFSSLQKQSRTISIGKSMGKCGEIASKYFTRMITSQSKHISSYLGQAPEEFDDHTTELDQYRSTCLHSVRVFGQKIEK